MVLLEAVLQARPLHLRLRPGSAWTAGFPWQPGECGCTRCSECELQDMSSASAPRPSTLQVVVKIAYLYFNAKQARVMS